MDFEDIVTDDANDTNNANDNNDKDGNDDKGILALGLDRDMGGGLRISLEIDLFCT